MKSLGIHLTPITEERLKSVGFEKVVEKDRAVEEYSFIIRLPKNSIDPHCMCLVTSYSSEWTELKLSEGEFIVEMYDSGGLGTCVTMEELELLYYVLTKKSIYEG